MLALRSIALLMALLALTVEDTLARVDVKIDFDKSFDFKPVARWGWNPKGYGDLKMARTANDNPEAMKKLAEPIIVDAVTTEFARRGLQHAPSEPDIVVTYYAFLTAGAEAQTMGQFLPSTTAWAMPPFAQSTQSLKIMNRGSLVLDLAAKGTVVWRGVAQAQIKMGADAKKQETLIREAVRDLLRRFPPKQ